MKRLYLMSIQEPPRPRPTFASIVGNITLIFLTGGLWIFWLLFKAIMLWR